MRNRRNISLMLLALTAALVLPLAVASASVAYQQEGCDGGCQQEGCDGACDSPAAECGCSSGQACNASRRRLGLINARLTGSAGGDCGCQSGGCQSGGCQSGGGSRAGDALHQDLASQCQMQQHHAYYPPMHGYYYFRPYHHSHLQTQQQQVAAGWSADPRNPYANELFQDVYAEIEAINAEENPTPPSAFTPELDPEATPPLPTPQTLDTLELREAPMPPKSGV